MTGSDAASCGEFGAVCNDCAGKGETCDQHACATGSTCPAPYAGCNPKKITAPPKPGTSCSTAELDALEMACTGAGAGCGAAFGKLMQKNPSCFGCMFQFTGNDAYAKCLAPYLGAACNHALSCALDCSGSCDGCATSDKKACQDALFTSGAQCDTWVGGYYCAQAAIMGPAGFCDFAAAGNDGGKWIHTVGAHYCQ